MKKALILALLVFISISQGFSQKTTKIIVSEKAVNQKPTIIESSSLTKFSIKESIFDISAVTKPTKDGSYIEIVGDGLMKTYNAGNPDLPVITKLIEIPANQTVKINIVSFKEKQIKLADYTIKEQIIPAQESVSKSDDPDKITFKKNKEIYNKNGFYQPKFVTFEDEGYLRNKHLGFIQISPFEYNPVTNTLLVKYDFEIEIEFVPDNKSSIVIDERLQSPYFENLPLQTINSTADTKALIQGPVKYVIVSDIMFQTTLQPFIEWKRMKGFKVVEAYTNNPSVGTTTASIKTYLQGLYNTPDDGTAPIFVLLVGDVAQIPAFSGTSGSHVTDLYYYDYTNDKMPDVFGGRFSATTIEQLQSQIDKTLQVEKYLMPDPSYLNNVVLIAGVDASYAPTYGNGFVNYANTYYTNAANGITSLSYLYPASASADETIRANISAGVALANYTAHCSSSGWGDPSFSISHIPSMTNVNMYPLMIGNCCQSVMFGGNCFGEEIVRAANKGAVGYIGASNNTYWDEDYYWGIGKRSSITADPTYDAANLGAYDRFFHSHDEAKDNWYITQGQINVAGNLAVESSSSSRKLYYWEIYHLMGDPSLTPFVKEPSALIANFNSEIIIGASSFEVSTEEDAFVAISLNGTLLDAKISGADGLVNLAFSPLTEVDIAKLVITKQNRIPKIVDISIIPSTTPYVIKENITINDEVGGNNNGVIDYGEQIKLSITLKNVSETFEAYNVIAKLSSTDSNVVIIDSIENFGTILTDTVSLIEDAFTFEIENEIVDQTPVNFNLEITGTDGNSNTYTWKSAINLNLNAPVIEIGDILIDDFAGDNDGILDPGETANLQLVVSNTGHASISDLKALVVMLNNGDTIINLNTSVINNVFIDAQSTDTIIFNITANSLINPGQKVYFDFWVKDTIYNFYSKRVYRELIIGDIPSILISQQGTVTANHAYFYDSGGESNNYLNNEDYTITFTPLNANENIQAEFFIFEIESHSTCDYDYLTVYDGLTTSSQLIGKYCGTNSPGKIVATNPDGALTFVYHSDYSDTRKGWKALISSKKSHSYSLLVTNNDGPVQSASVSLNENIIITSADGIATFESVPEGINIPLKVTATGFSDHVQIINLFENSTDTVLLKISKHTITFKLSDKTNQSSLNGEVTFNGLTLSTIQGQAIFTNVEYGMDKEYSISSIGYDLYIDTLDVTDDLTKQVLLDPSKYNVTFIVSGSEGLVEKALINFNNEDKLTNSNGEVVFNDVSHKSNCPYQIRKPGYENYLDTMDVYSDVNENITLTPGTAIYQVSFNVTDGTNPLEEAIILFDGQEKSTNTEGNCLFDSVEYGLNKKYTITKDKYYQYTDSVDVDSNLVENASMTLITFNITFLVTSNENSGPLEDVIVAFNSENKITNSEGIAIFNNVSPKSGIAYSLTKTGYTTITGTLDVANENKSVSFAMSVVSSVNDIMPGEVSVFPNPSQGIINIRFEERKENIQINVYDVIGKSVFTKTLPQIENIEIIDLTNQPKGLYFISIKSGDGEVISKKILIK